MTIETSSLAAESFPALYHKLLNLCSCEYHGEILEDVHELPVHAVLFINHSAPPGVTTIDIVEGIEEFIAVPAARIVDDDAICIDISGRQHNPIHPGFRTLGCGFL